MFANRFFSAHVRIQTERGHAVVDSGPYGVVRHPGYVGMSIFTLGTPLALGSWLAQIPAILTVAVLIYRTALEDRTLQAELPGYADYAGRVRYRLLPGLW
jgi:protein-S-isoprenylcysteine O-methyltransferase Ste14